MSIEAKFDPLLFKYPKGVISKNKEVKFFVEYCGDQPKHVYFMIKSDEESDYKYIEMNKNNNGFEIVYNFENSGHFWYNFQIVLEDCYLYLNKSWNYFSELLPYKTEDFLQLVTEKEYTCTNSMQGGIIYQIFVDRFAKKGNVVVREPLILRDDWGGDIKKNTTNPVEINLEVFGGNFAGIIEKLDYLKDLNVTTIYLNPIQQANSNHKYNTSNYMKIDDMYGTEEEFKQLIEEAKKRNIQIVIDGVYNHTGSDSIYFNKNGTFETVGAYQSKDSKYYSWYDFEEYPNKYRSWWGIDTLPSINHNCEEFQSYIAGKNGVLEKFLKMGVAGVRLDVVDEITDEFVQKIEQKVHEYGENKIVIGEVWEDASTKESYSVRRKYFSNNELNSVMNYPIKESVIEFIKTKNSNTLESTIRLIENNYPKVVRDNLMNFLTTHDTERFFSVLKSFAKDDQTAIELYKIASILIFTLPGVPSIFYGDEYGMENNAGSSRGCFDWKNHNNEVYKWIKNLSKIRQLSCLKDGEINIIYSKNGKFVFERFNKTDRIIVLINLSESKFRVDLQGSYHSYFSQKNAKSFEIKENEYDILIEENK